MFFGPESGNRYLAWLLVLPALFVTQATLVSPVLADTSGSAVLDIQPDPVIPGTFDIGFRPDFQPGPELFERFDITVPSGWTVNSVYNLPSDSGCDVTVQGVEADGRTIYWQDEFFPVLDGCGAWYGADYWFYANVTVPDCSGAPWSLDWNMYTDGTGTPPHSGSGTYAPLSCHIPLPLELSPHSLEVSGCYAAAQTHTFQLLNGTGSDGTFDLAYTVTSGAASLTGPESIFVADGDTGTITVELLPCDSAGGVVTAEVTATGNGHADTSVITKSVIVTEFWEMKTPAPTQGMDNVVVSAVFDGGLWSIGGYLTNGAAERYDPTLDVWTSHSQPPAPFIRVPMDGCYGLNSNGDEIVVLFPDTTGSPFGQINRYNITTDTWDAPSTPPGFPAIGLFAEEVVSMYGVTAENICYISGGATTPGGGNLRDLWAYFPETNTAVKLGEFTHIPAGFNHHASWYVPWVGDAGAICVAGGSDWSDINYADTQCYDLATSTFNPPNADLGPLPEPWDAMADGWRIHEGEYQIWMAGGAKFDHQITRDSAYMDSQSGGFQYGPILIEDVARAEGDNWGGEFYVLKGTKCYFNPSEYTQHLRRCSDFPDMDSDGVANACDACPLDPDNDADGDGVCGDVDNCPANANPGQADADADGIGDACDTCPNDADNDADGDGICGDVDNCRWVANPDQADRDGDGLGNVCDACPRDPLNDFDQDHVCGNVDNCPFDANSGQEDADSDGRGDACDACPNDPDNDQDADGVCGDVDNCPGDANPAQEDADSDGQGDICDICPNDPDDDSDADGLCGDVDNCPLDANAGQEDADSDGQGDACDACPYDPDNDVDADTVCGDVDNCPATANPYQEDTDADTLGDACDACPNDAANDADSDGVCGDVDNCPAVTNADQTDFDMDTLGDSCDACPYDADNDLDGDGFCGDVDNCPAIANPGQENLDADMLGDACDTCPADPDNDLDGDGVCGDVDNCPAIANPMQGNLDADMLGDACDACPNDADNDADSDGICGDIDNCPAAPNPGQEDSDLDTAGDACDVCPDDADNDADDDGVCGDIDNCPADANAGQEDGDSDGIGDLCDTCPFDENNDSDGDGVCGDVDNCPSAANPDQNDDDSDGQGNECDACQNDSEDDSDADGVCGDVDNCPSDANPDQTDSDADGAGDVCDTCPDDAEDDADGDGICGDVDNCPAEPNPDQLDTDLDGVGDSCDNCPRKSNPDQADTDGNGTGDSCEASGCGSHPQISPISRFWPYYLQC